VQLFYGMKMHVCEGRRGFWRVREERRGADRHVMRRGRARQRYSHLARLFDMNATVLTAAGQDGWMPGMPARSLRVAQRSRCRVSKPSASTDDSEDRRSAKSRARPLRDRGAWLLLPPPTAIPPPTADPIPDAQDLFDLAAPTSPV
jgi:hypothetical protein